MQYLKSDVELAVRPIPVPYLLHTRCRPNKIFSKYSPCIIVGTGKHQSSFHTLRIKYAIQTLRIRQHRNVHSGHVGLISSHMCPSATRPLCFRWVAKRRHFLPVCLSRCSSSRSVGESTARRFVPCDAGLTESKLPILM